MGSSVRGLETFSLPNRGLTTMTSLRCWSPNTYLLPLNCSRTGSEYPISVLLRRISGEAQYARVQTTREQLIDDARCEVGYLKHSPFRCEDIVDLPRSVPPYITSRLQDYVYGFHIDMPGLELLSPESIRCRGQWIERDTLLL